MFGWFQSKTPAAPPVARAPEGLRIYAIGDIHGRLDCLDELLEKIVADSADYRGRKLVIGLGDYIDRGPDSKSVIDRLMAPLPGGLEGEFLRGNHEQALLDLFITERPEAGWLTYGGVNTLLSYGITLSSGAYTPERLYELQAKLRAHFPLAHKQWLQQLPTHLTYGDYHFVHAGVRPGVALEQQSDDDRMWIRHLFLSHTDPLEKIIVHGHTISEEVELRPHRIGIDTGAYATGRLSALVLEGEHQRVLQTGIGGAAVT